MEIKNNLYYPDKEFKEKSRVSDNEIYAKANKDPILFWEKIAEELNWQEKWTKGFEHTPPYFKWFLNGKLNITESAIDRHLKDRGDKTAMTWIPESLDESVRRLTYRELSESVNKFAKALLNLGIKKGDRVGIYLPMIPEVIISMLACARIGAIHAIVFSAFSPTALQARLQDSEAKILVTADGYYRGGKLINLKNNADDFSINSAHQQFLFASKLISFPALFTTTIFSTVVPSIASSAECEPESMDSEDPLFILYTSGSTGKPKGCLHTTGGYMVQAYATTKFIFDLRDDDVFWSTADIGWITGHTYSCYGPLLCGGSFVIFEGLITCPAPDRWARIIDAQKVSVFYTAPTAIRMMEENGADAFKKCELKTLRLLGSVGEPIDESAWQWYFKEVGKEKCPIVDTWWQTETGGILISSLPGLGPFKPSFTGLPFPGIQIDILDDDGKSLTPNTQGNLVILPPFAPGLLRGIYKNQEKYKETYWSRYGDGIYFTSDGAFRDERGLVRIIGRVDDVIKVAGHRISTGEMEAAINLHLEISESAVVGMADPIKGEVPIAFVVYQGAKNFEEITNEIIAGIRKVIGPIALPQKVYLVQDLPKTRSGKIMRRILRKILANEDLGDLSTLANPESAEKIKTIIQR